MSATATTPQAVDPGPCPLCGQQLYGWAALPPGGPTIGAPVTPRSERILDRCENCGVAVERGREVDTEAEWEAVCRPGEAGRRRITVPNRDSVQAWLGGVGWAGLDRSPGRLIHTPESLRLLAAANGQRIDHRHPAISRHGQAWMWQTMLNGLTFHPNFAREVRAGRLRPANSRGKLRFGVDAVVTVLAAPLVFLVSAPLELGAALARRGGELHAVAGPAGG